MSQVIPCQLRHQVLSIQTVCMIRKNKPLPIAENESAVAIYILFQKLNGKNKIVQVFYCLTTLLFTISNPSK